MGLAAAASTVTAVQTMLMEVAAIAIVPWFNNTEFAISKGEA
jgi:hypothetical membrane protein